MKTHLTIVLVLLAAMFVALPTPQAQACQGCGGGWGNGWGYDSGYLYNTLAYNVPYFAAFPPVYYSYPVPRTYGYSPFAYPPGVMTPDVVMESSQPIEIINPYVPSSQQEKAKTQADKTADTAKDRQPEPLVILNPYVTQRTVATATP
jgi:hypothetical protein